MRAKLKLQWFLVPLILTLYLSGFFLYKTAPVQVIAVRTTSHTTQASISFAPLRHVTKSLAELDKMDEISKNFLFFNHVPKCGSEVLILLLQKMQGFNNFRHVRLKGGSKRKLNRLQQEELVEEFYDILRKQPVRLSFDRHTYFVNFTSFDKQSPTYINLIRDPIDKIVSRSPGKNGKGSNEYYYKCLMKKKGDCNFKNGLSYDLSIPYFCGQDSRCMILNNDWALKTAKENVQRYFEVVGVLEELNSTLEVLENKLPNFFKGVQKHYQTYLLSNFKNKKPIKVPNRIRKKLKDTLRTEYDFYDWIKGRLFGQLQILYGDHQSH
ncbi:unnamed protein product [Brassicogethes aeneus]|uniref:Uncharacterized protein n=1 Tax=Brassicogethes aeneus TaxID=1431903 RepID=A0A9P0FH48_BRAAE|nr:unnamed protein product [Brassicogethes aeneus]